MAEVLLNQKGQGRFRAFSAGSHPKGQVHPLALEVLQRMNLPIDGLRSKSWDEFAGPDAPEARLRVHRVRERGQGDLSHVARPADDRPLGCRRSRGRRGDARREEPSAFLRALTELDARIRLFSLLPFESLSQMSLQHKIREIGEMK